MALDGKKDKKKKKTLRFGSVVSVCVFDLPTYMTTGVHVDVILTCFFSCKDRASKRYRPYQRKKHGRKKR